jgi:hypothetical protein
MIFCGGSRPVLQKMLREGIQYLKGENMLYWAWEGKDIEPGGEKI